MQLSQAKLKALAEYFEDQPVTSVHLFGSYARGDADAESDVDLVVTPAGETRPSLDLASCRRDLEELLLLRVEIYVEHKLPRYVREGIVKERILLYLKK